MTPTTNELFAATNPPVTTAWRHSTLLSLVALALLLRVAASLLLLPSSVIFDEVHFGSFVNAYCCNGERFFDIHPPLGKLLIAAVAKLVGYDGTFGYQHIGNAFPALPWAVRLAPALAGALLPVVAFALVRSLGGLPATAWLVAVALYFDNALILQSSVIGVDATLLLGTLAALLFAVIATRTGSGRRRVLAALAAGGGAALAVGSKFTGLVALALPLAWFAAVLWSRRLRFGEFAGLTLLVVAAAASLYLAAWQVHFLLLTEPGPGDAWGAAADGFFAETWRLHRTMLAANAGLAATHHDASPWWGWPVMNTPVFYWSAPGGRTLYLIGNPVVWLGTAFGLVLALGTLLLARASDLGRVVGRHGLERPPIWLPLLGYAAAYLPLALVDRTLFLYHYLTPLCFALLAVAIWLERIGWIRPGGWRAQRPSYLLLLGLVVLGCWLLAPLTYGTDSGVWVTEWLFGWLPGWR